MLAIQIAAGIVLAAVVLRFWRQSLWVAAAILALFLLLIVGLWFASSSAGKTVLSPTWLGNIAIIFWSLVIAYAIRERIRRNRANREP